MGSGVDRQYITAVEVGHLSSNIISLLAYQRRGRAMVTNEIKGDGSGVARGIADGKELKL